MGLIGHLASLGRYLAEHERRAHADETALAELSDAAARTLALPAGLELEWLGTAGYRLTYERQSLYIDPYVSRVPFGAVLRSTPVKADLALHERFLKAPGEVLGVLVGHTHFDHAIDIPAFCSRNRCAAYGSASLAHLMALHNQSDRAVRVTPHVPIELGPFVVTFIPSVHSKLLLGYKVPSDGELTCDHLDALSPGAYKCGQVWGIHVAVAGTTFYHQGSANLLDEEIRQRGVDVFLAGIAGRRFTDRYWPRIIGALQPRVIVASHFDDFFRPLDERSGFSLNVNLAAFPEEIDVVSRDVEVAALQPFISVGRPSGGSSQTPHSRIA